GTFAIPGKNGSAVPQLSTPTCVPSGVIPASARPITAESCADVFRDNTVVSPQLNRRFMPELVPVCAKVNRTSILSPGCRRAVGISQAPTVVRVVEFVEIPALLHSTCAAAVRSPGPSDNPPIFPAVEGSTRYDAVNRSPACGVAPGTNWTVDPLSV